MRPRGFVELTFFRGDKILLVSPEGIVSVEPLTVTDGVVTMIRVQGEHGLRAVNGTLDEVAAAIDAAMRERERDTARAARIAAIGCRREAMAARVEYYRCVNAERLANGCAIAYDGALNEAAYALDALAAEAAALIEEDGE